MEGPRTWALSRGVVGLLDVTCCPTPPCGSLLRGPGAFVCRSRWHQGESWASMQSRAPSSLPMVGSCLWVSLGEGPQPTSQGLKQSSVLPWASSTLVCDSVASLHAQA